MRHKPSQLLAIITLFAVLFTNIRLQAQELASAEIARSSMIEHIVKERPLLVELLTKAGLVPLLSGNAAYTLFAPPESDLNELKNQPVEQIRLIMAGHIIKGRYFEKDLKDGAKLESLNGKTVTICRKEGTLINGVSIAKANTEVQNGIIHSIHNAFTY